MDKGEGGGEVVSKATVTLRWWGVETIVWFYRQNSRIS